MQPLISAAGVKLAPSICYEDAYGSTERPQLAAGATLLVNVTNDAWFGHSWARYQHLQISRMRALEAQRPLIRAANDGVSALIGSNGQVLAEAAEFKPTVLHGSVQPRTGLTGYARLGNELVVVLCLLGAGCAIGHRFGQFQEPVTQTLVYHCLVGLSLARRRACLSNGIGGRGCSPRPCL